MSNPDSSRHDTFRLGSRTKAIMATHKPMANAVEERRAVSSTAAGERSGPGRAGPSRPTVHEEPVPRQNPDQHQHDGEREGEELGQGEASAAAEGNPAGRRVRAAFTTDTTNTRPNKHHARVHAHVHGPRAGITPLSSEQTAVCWVFRRMRSDCNQQKIGLFVHIRVALRGSRWSQNS